MERATWVATHPEAVRCGVGGRLSETGVKQVYGVLTICKYLNQIEFYPMNRVVEWGTARRLSDSDSAAAIWGGSLPINGSQSTGFPV